jgi:hypothetical protein
MKKIWVKFHDRFSDADRFERGYYRSMKPRNRLDLMLKLRDIAGNNGVKKRVRLEKDYIDLLRLFNRHRVKYCIVGAYALAFYARPRYTKDLDILVQTSVENGKRIVRSLNEFGFGALGLTADDFVGEGRIIQLGYEPVRIDLVTAIDGCRFVDVWRSRVRVRWSGIIVNIIGLSELRKNKRASGRLQDLADLELMEK